MGDAGRSLRRAAGHDGRADHRGGRPGCRHAGRDRRAADGLAGVSWNGLAFTAVGELAGPGRAGAALGLQNTGVALGAALTAPLLGAVVDRTAWAVGYSVAAACGLAAVLLLRGLAAEEFRGERHH